MDFEVEILDDIYEVERILDAKRKDGKMCYKVRWEGYGSEEDSWEPMDNLLTCQELVDRYWIQRKDGYKKRGRKPKRHKEAAEEETDGSDMEEGQKDENEEEGEMTLQPPKRKRGRPPKQQIVSDTGSQEQSPDRGSSSSPELSDQNAAKKRRMRPIKEEEFSSRICEQFLLLDHEIAPLGMTRQASKELALVSLRKKQERETLTSSKSEVRTATATEEAVSSEMNQDGFAGSESQDYFEVIEISSQSSNEDEEQMISSQELEPVVKEYIEISSQDESEGEEISAKQVQDSSKTKMKDSSGKEMSLILEAENEKTGKRADSGVHKIGLSKVKRTFAEDHSGENSHSSSSDPFPPIDVSFESNSALAEDKREKNASGNAEEIPEAFSTDENSNQVMSCSSSVPPKASVTSKFSVSKIQSLFKKSAQERNSGSLENYSEPKSIKDLSVTSVNNLNVPVTSVSLKSSRTQVLSSTSEPGRRVLESNANRRVHNDMETAAARTSLAMHASQMVSQDDIGTAKRRSEKIGERSFTGKARRTDGRPKSIRDLKKRLSLDSSLGFQQNSSVTAKPGNAENLSVGINEALGKPEKQMITSTTADLLPMRNKTSSAPLMDGDLLGTIIQDSGEMDESKAKPQTGTQAAARKEGISQKKANDEREKLKPWDSGMEDISDGEDDLSDFEFDLDDYSPHSFFSDVKESNLIERTPSPVVEPLNLSLAALKQAIREGDIIQVRRALSVPALNPDTIDTASGMSLLMWAATYGQDDIVKLLLRRGAGVNSTDQKRNAVTALMQAAEQGFPETVQILLESGAHINCQTTAGETALMRACKKGHKEVVEILLRNGVDTKAQSTHELTAVQIALKNQHFEIQNLLSDHEESLANSLQIALGKCLGTAGTLRLPLLMPYRCIAPGERECDVFNIKYDSSKVPQGSKVVLFCVRADFNGDEVCYSFGGDNGVRTVLFNGSIQYPLVQGNRSVFLLTPEAEVSSNVLTVKTHTMKTARLIVCVANVSATNKIS